MLICTLLESCEIKVSPIVFTSLWLELIPRFNYGLPLFKVYNLVQEMVIVFYFCA